MRKLIRYDFTLDAFTVIRVLSYFDVLRNDTNHLLNRADVSYDPNHARNALASAACLLRHVRQHGANNVRELARAMGRDYKNVPQHVTVLGATGLLFRVGHKLSAPWDELQAHVSLLPS